MTAMGTCAKGAHSGAAARMPVENRSWVFSAHSPPPSPDCGRRLSRFRTSPATSPIRRRPAFKRTDTSFQDLIPDNIPSKQLAGSVVANSRTTNTVQGDMQAASVATFMAINGAGFFVVEKPDSFADGRPNFGGVDQYTRRGDFQLDQNGYLVNGAGYYLMGIPIEPRPETWPVACRKCCSSRTGFCRRSRPRKSTTAPTCRTIRRRSTLTPRSRLGTAQPLEFHRQSGRRCAGDRQDDRQWRHTVAGRRGGADRLGIADLAIGAGRRRWGINGTSIAIASGDNAAALLTKINAQTATTNGRVDSIAPIIWYSPAPTLRPISASAGPARSAC